METLIFGLLALALLAGIAYFVRGALQKDFAPTPGAGDAAPSGKPSDGTDNTKAR